MKYKVDLARIRERQILLNGWAIGKNKDSIAQFSVEDSMGHPVGFTLVQTRRDDVSQAYFDEIIQRELGFDIRFAYDIEKDYYLCITCEGKRVREKFNKDIIYKRSLVAYKKWERIKSLFHIQTFLEAFDFLKKHGIRALYKKTKAKLKGMDSDYEYAEWFDVTKPTQEELEKQRSCIWKEPVLFSIVIPLFSTPNQYLIELLDSIYAQTYGHFEICLADGSPEGADKEACIYDYIQKQVQTKDLENKIKYTKLGKNLGIAGNTNAALAMATGEYVVLCDHDDVFTPDALYACASKIKECGADCLYSDEDKLDMDGGTLFDPHFKPDFNMDMLCSVNYICHLFVVKKELVDKYGGFDSTFDGAQDYDFIFRMTEQAKTIAHIPKVLYHWRCHMHSTASNPESKLYAFDAGARAIEAHYARVHKELSIAKIEKGIDYGIYHTFFTLKEEPLVSVVIPNKDHHKDLDLAIRSLCEKGTYKNLEFIIVENNSSEEATWHYYENIQKEYSFVKVVKWEKEFNYSALNNFGASFSGGDYLLFMNNDIEVKNPDVLYELLGYAQREDVGIVGCRLLYPDDTIQHAGVVVGFGGIAGHTFIGISDYERSYFNRALIAQNYSAVTAACMLTKKEVFDAVGGFSKELAVAFNDIDFCLKVRELGKLVVYNPYALLYHYESKSRGLEDTPEKIERFNKEIATFMKKWPRILEKGDPYYNPNLTLRKSNFALRDLHNEKIGEPYHIEGIEKYL